MKSYFYKVVAQHIELTYWKRTFLWHSTQELSSFSKSVQDMMPEWTIDFIREIEFTDMEIVDHWDNE